ncbi:MAG: RNA methyltransferase [Thermoplasmata archaeon]|nr:RNA methyltransferase [Thermoplasmata archaeon]MCI4359365.1 RNA methyltransferase [Thermoplasmata archaeon]
MSAEIEVVLVRPKEDGNVGAVARAARNFGADRLTFVAPRAELGPVARRRAMGGLALLESAKAVATFAEAVGEADLVVGTTDLVTGRSTAYLRRSVSPERLGEALRSVVGRVAVVFGPEDNGLSRSELARCDLLVHVPARREFPTLNLSHAVAIVLYALHRARGGEDPETTPAPEVLELDGKGKEVFLLHLGQLLEQTGYPSHKRAGMVLMFRRVLGRAAPGESEYRMMLGLLKSSRRAIRRGHGR